MFDQLIWKELQNLKGVLVLGLFFLIAPYGLVITNSFAEDSLPIAAFISMVASQLTIVVLGATVIGVERQNRSMEFLLGLPVSKSKVLLSKALICLVVAALIWGTFTLVVELFVSADIRPDLRRIGLGAFLVGFVLFGIAWLCSILLKGLAIPITVSLAVTTAIVAAVGNYASRQEWPIDEYGKNFYAIVFTIYAVVGAISIIVGWVLFVRRCEP